jgi:hypothetical protein
MAHLHAICLDHQHAWRCIVRQFAGWRLGCLHLLNGASLLALQFGAHPLGMRPQRFTANLHAGQFIQ